MRLAAHKWERADMRLRRTGTLTKIIIAILLVYAVVSLVRISAQRDARLAELADLRRQQADIAATIDDIQYKVEHSDDDDVIRDIAREELGLVEPDEQIYYAG